MTDDMELMFCSIISACTCDIRFRKATISDLSRMDANWLMSFACIVTPLHNRDNVTSLRSIGQQLLPHHLP
jgi:hypothetical protein